MKVLVACEESQIITAKYRGKGIESYSCDLKALDFQSIYGKYKEFVKERKIKYYEKDSE